MKKVFFLLQLSIFMVSTTHIIASHSQEDEYQTDNVTHETERNDSDKKEQQYLKDNIEKWLAASDEKFKEIEFETSKIREQISHIINIVYNKCEYLNENVIKKTKKFLFEIITSTTNEIKDIPEKLAKCLEIIIQSGEKISKNLNEYTDNLEKEDKKRLIINKMILGTMSFIFIASSIYR